MNEEQKNLFYQWLWEKYNELRKKSNDVAQSKENKEKESEERYQLIKQQLTELKENSDVGIEKMRGQYESIKESHRVLTEAYNKLKENYAERGKEIASLKLSQMRLKEQVEYSRLKGFVYPKANDITKLMSELKNEADKVVEKDKANKEEQLKPTAKPQMGATRLDGDKVPYKYENGVFTTICDRGGCKPNNGKPCNVGSGICAKCPWNVGVNTVEQYVVCTKTKA